MFKKKGPYIESEAERRISTKRKTNRNNTKSREFIADGCRRTLHGEKFSIAFAKTAVFFSGSLGSFSSTLKTVLILAPAFARKICTRLISRRNSLLVKSSVVRIVEDTGNTKEERRRTEGFFELILKTAAS
ncbi:unnamed protein product [Allacma fusca]|uniref:Uncharacterized protein n=1 Tax=Allacma fusca TaxID=39272 RepID=A0A8J2LQL0_9HEXA|nr:unnamed protein product [Allacma fusca]